MIRPTAESPVCDLACWIGQYPLRRLREQSLDDLLARSRRTGVTRAVVCGYDQLFAQNGLDYWFDWLRRIDRHEGAREMVEYWPVVNPSHPGELRRLEAGLRQTPCRGLRLLPSYHGYRAWDPAIAELMALARQRDLVVQVFVRIADERWHWMQQTPPLDIGQDLAYLTSMFPDNRLLISAANGAELSAMSTRLRTHGSLYADLSRVRGPIFALDNLPQWLPLQRVVFGSLWPVQIVEASLWEINLSTLSAQQQRMILWDNAQQLLAAPTSRNRPVLAPVP
jgi:hypothetical protein